MCLWFLLTYIIYVYQCVVIYLGSITDNENKMIKINYITMIIKTCFAAYYYDVTDVKLLNAVLQLTNLLI